MDHRMEEDSRMQVLPRGRREEVYPLGATMTADEGFFSHVVAERATTRSPRIPFPSGYISRTQSEIQLTIDQERAKQHELQMFHRLVNGIRDRQQHLGSSHLVSTDGLPPSRFMENTPAIAAVIVPFHPVTKPYQTTARTPPTKLAAPQPLLPWLFQQTNTTSTTTAAAGLLVPTAVQDDWSISGFDDGGGEDCYSMSSTGGAEQQALLLAAACNKNYYHHNNNNCRLAFDHHHQQGLATTRTTKRTAITTTTTTAAPWGSADYDDDAHEQKDGDPPEEEIFQLDF
jgi:hypothetical protein